MKKSRLVHGFKLMTKDLIKLIIILGVMVVVGIIVYISGGVSLSYTHLMYIPILVTAYMFNIWVTIIIAAIAGLIIGPFMPQDVALNIMQNIEVWLFRVVMFMLIGTVGSLISMRIKRLQKIEIERLYTNRLTNYPNFNKLRHDLDFFTESRTPFYLLAFRVVNMNSIRQNTSYDIGNRVLIKLLDLLSESGQTHVYSIYSDEIGLIIPTGTYEEATQIGKQFLQKSIEFMYLDNCKISAMINGSIVQYPNDIKNTNDAIKKMTIILDQKLNDYGLHAFDFEIEHKSKFQSELISDILQALENDEFSLVYQPKVHLTQNKDFEAEALIRWQHPTKGMISPGIFIPIAEEAGIITEITKRVIKKVMNQQEAWKNEGFDIRVSMNISHKDFNNKEFLDFFMDLIHKPSIDASLIEIEVTERGVIENTQSLISLFEKVRSLGVKVSIDDFGTGYNSFINLVKVPMDYLKIDKSFIDYITKDKYKLMIAQIIQLAHGMGIQVIAEGVEAKEQLDILQSMDCDIIQGYYMSKPLPPDEVLAYFKKTSRDK